MMYKKGSLYTAFFVFFVDNFGFAVVYPLFGPLLLNPEYSLLPVGTTPHVRNILLSVLFIAYPLAQFFGAPFFGDFADRWGRKKAFYFTIGGVMVGYFFSAIALMFNTYVGLIISRLFTGFFAGNMSISLATIADVSPSEKLRTRNFGINSTIAGLSWILAMLVGGDLSNPHLLKFLNPSIPFWITGVFTGLGFLIVVWVFKETNPPLKTSKINFLKGFKDLKLAFTLPTVRGLFLVYLCWTTSWLLVVAWLSGISVEKFHLSQAAIAWILIGNGVSWMIANTVVSGYLIKQMSVGHLACLSYALCGLSLLFSMIAGVWTFAILFVVATGFAGVAWTSTLSLISINAPNEIQGITMGLGQSVMALGFILGPLLGGWLANVTIVLPYIFAGALMLVGLIVLMMWLHFHRSSNP